MRRITGALICATLALALAGCAGVASDYPATTASAFQQQVLATTSAAADGDYEAAITRLDELEVAVADALADGTISQARGDSILGAIALVRADLVALLDGPGKSDEPKPDKPKPDKPGKPDKD